MCQTKKLNKIVNKIQTIKYNMYIDKDYVGICFSSLQHIYTNNITTVYYSGRELSFHKKHSKNRGAFLFVNYGKYY